MNAAGIVISGMALVKNEQYGTTVLCGRLHPVQGIAARWVSRDSTASAFIPYLEVGPDIARRSNRTTTLPGRRAATLPVRRRAR